MRSLIVLLLSAFALACGSGPSARSAADTGPRLDWALLLPIETDGLVRVDLERMRRSPHRTSVQPVFHDFLGQLAFSEAQTMSGAIEGVLARTDVLMIGLLPRAEGAEDEVLILARGQYRANELEALAGNGSPRDVDGHRVWVQDDEEGGRAIARLREDTLAMTASFERMHRLIARTRMASSPRWPPAVRALVAASGFEDATVGVALSNRGVGAAEGDLASMSIAAVADVDGPLDVELMMELGDAELAMAATVFLDALVQELARSAVGQAFALAELAELTRIEANGTRVVGTIHAEPRSAEQLVPGLMGLLRDGFQEEEQPTFASPLPRPI